MTTSDFLRLFPFLPLSVPADFCGAVFLELDGVDTEFVVAVEVVAALAASSSVLDASIGADEISLGFVSIDEVFARHDA